MTFDEWWDTYLYLGDDLDKELAKAAWNEATCKTNLQIEQLEAEVENYITIISRLEGALARYSMDAGRCDQYKNEALAMRKALGFSADSENVAPIDLLNKLDEVVNLKLTPEGYVLVPVAELRQIEDAIAFELGGEPCGLHAAHDLVKAMIQSSNGQAK